MQWRKFSFSGVCGGGGGGRGNIATIIVTGGPLSR